MKKISSLFIKGISVLPALLIMPAMATVITTDTEYTDAYVSSGHSNPRGGDFEANGAHIVFKNTATFDNNRTTGEPQNNGYGGAIFIDGVADRENTSVEFEQDATFSNNNAISGGAVYNQATLIFDSGVTFENNSADQSGALVGHMNSITEFKDTATFAGNHSHTTSGAVSNAGEMTFAGLATFTRNYAETNQSSSVGNSGTMTFQNGLVVDSNGFDSDNNFLSLSGFGNSGTLNVTGGDVEITNNKANRYSGLYASGGNTIMSGVGKINFDGNQAIGSSAGALGLHENAELVSLTADNIIFNNNTSNGNGYGGAIFSASDLSILGNNNTFSNNTSTTTGYGDKDETYFGGGAIHARSVNDDDSVIIGTENSVNKFNNNTSNEQGGAILARNSVDVTVNGKTTFTGNTAAKNGGAIYVRDSASVITFNGNTTFTRNTAGGVANDIYNNGTINFNGDTTLDGGITGDGVLNIANGTTFDIGTASIHQGIINLDGTMLATLRSGDDAQITTGTFDGDGTLKLSFDKSGTYNVFGDAKFANIDISNPVYDLVWNGGRVSTVAKSATDIANGAGLSADSGNTISALVQSNDDTANQISLKIQDALNNGDADYVEGEIAKMNPAKAPVITSVALNLQNQVFSAAGERMSLALTGRNAGDIHADLGVWAKGTYNKTKHHKSFTGETFAGSVGFDTDLNHSVILGVGYSFGDTNVDLHTHDVDIDSHTLFVYGQYRNSDWFVNGTIAYTMSKYDWNKNVFGINNNPSYHVNSLSEQIMGGYHFDNGITPTLGLRYLDVHQDSYSDGITSVAATDSKYLTGVAGVDYKYTWIAPHTSVFWNPELHVAATYDMVSDSDTAIVMIPGAAAYAVDVDNLSRLGGEFGVGISAEYYYLTVSLNYDLNLHRDYQSHTGSLKVKYKF
jgi:predicted outer membrane repeat protein